MIASGEDDHDKKKDRIWEESKYNYGNTVDVIKAEFQSLSLNSIRTTYITKDKVKIGDKKLYECSKTHCDFAARIVLYRMPGSTPKVEVSGKMRLRHLPNSNRRT